MTKVIIYYRNMFIVQATSVTLNYQNKPKCTASFWVQGSLRALIG